MKATDLRIGNYVIFKSIQMVTLNQNGKYENYEEPHQLHQIQISSNDFEYIEKGQSEYRPIPLTEEWLLKFGFERHHSDYSNSVIYIKDVPNNNEFKWGVYPLELGSGFIINKSKNLKYVHQLQNLYFALTEEELNTKELK
jgi:hypothetical protein